MSYIDAFLEKDKDVIHIVERDKTGKRIYKDISALYEFYYDDPKGKYQTIYRTSVSKITTNSNKEFRKELKMQGNKKTWEADCNPVFKCLEKNYLGVESPKLHTCFLDIETDWNSGEDTTNPIGYAPTDNPYNKITAITIYLDWMDKLITLALPPKSLTRESAAEIAAKFDDTYLFQKESEMLDTFLTLIEDADVLSGWNSGGYDIPYIVGRIIRTLAKNDLRRLCLWDQMPRERKFEKYGAEQITYDLIGRVHLDYMDLYRNYTYEERHSYSLDAIGEHELDERKVSYEGSLDQLYNQDFYKFLDYNRQDVVLLAKLDKKLKFLDLTNEVAHSNTVLLPTTMGTVALVDQGITNEAHQLGYIVPNRPQHKSVTTFDSDGEETTQQDRAAGAYVAYPKVGMHEYIGAIDINSLYPSTIRALNMSPETIVGQLRPIMTDQYIANKVDAGASFSGAWEGLWGSLEYTAVMEMDRNTEVTIDWDNGDKPSVHSAKEVWSIIFESGQKWMLSANGTIFKYNYEGILPYMLAKWYSERKELQAKKKAATEKEEILFWDKKQHVKKILLNSAYGAALNAHFRYHDFRIGQSTTLTGRIITKHMTSFINECLTGVYQYDGNAVIYSDTDSAYFSVWPIIKDDVKADKMEWNKDICVQLYDGIAEQVNESFPAIMEKQCHCPKDRGSLIKGGRELIATSGIYVTKKRYAVLVYDLEGTRLDQLDETTAKKKGIHYGLGKVKAMGLDLKRSDTPKVVQEFLSRILLDTLLHKPREKVIEHIIEFKLSFAKLPAWEKGTPKRVNNLTNYIETEEREGKSGMPGHVRAAWNWNNLRKMYNDNYSLKIVDGMKIIVCKLKNNPLGYTSVAYPIDVLHIPDWFKDLPFDNALMEATIVDKKVENLLGVLKWDLANSTQTNSTFDSLFSFV
jgi:DNA polymerase elongation subunit (family B)